MKDKLQAELKQIPDVPVHMKNRIRVFLNDNGIHSLGEIDYDVRERYINWLNCLRGNTLRRKYICGFDAMKLESIKWSERVKTASEKKAKFAEEKIFLLYYPCYKIAKTFDPNQDKEILLWDFSHQGSKTLKRQIFSILVDTINRTKNENQKRRAILLPLQKLYLFSLKKGIKDLRKMTAGEEKDFLYNVVMECPAIYDSAKKIVGHCRKFLFVQNGRIYWQSYVWYMERLPIHESRGSRELRNIKLSYLELRETEYRKHLQKYMKYLLWVTEKSISNIRTSFLITKQFLQYLETEVLITIDSQTVRGFFERIEEENLTAISYNAKVRVIRDFLEYLYVHGDIPERVMQEKYYLKKSGAQIHKTKITQEELDIFTKYLKYFPEKIRIMCLLLIFTGIHKKSLFGIKTQDLVWKNEMGWLRVKAPRNGVYREMPIPLHLYSLIANYCVKEKRLPQDIIFQDKNGKEYTAQAFRKRIVEGCQRIKILDGKYVFSGNDYQRSTAHYLFEKGMSISAIRDYLGHQNDRLTKEYLNIGQEELDKKSREYFAEPRNSLASHISFKEQIKKRTEDEKT